MKRLGARPHATQRFRAGARINIPRAPRVMRAPVQRMTRTYNIYTGCHCNCNGGGMSRFMAGLTAFTGFFGMAMSLFGRGSEQTQTYNPYQAQNAYNTGYSQGYYTPGSYSTGYSQGTQYTPDNSEIQSLREEIQSLKEEIQQLQSLQGNGGASTTEQTTTDEDVSGADDGHGGGNTASTESKDNPCNYNNSYNNTNGFKYENKKMIIKDKNVPEIVTLSAFFLNDNKDTTISLAQKDWENDFNLMSGNKATMTEAEFEDWFNAYTTEAADRAKENSTPRQLVNTVNMTNSDKQFIQNLYKAMSNNGNTLSAVQFKSFMDGFFNDSNYNKDGSFSREEFVDYVNKKLKSEN